MVREQLRFGKQEPGRHSIRELKEAEWAGLKFLESDCEEEQVRRELAGRPAGGSQAVAFTKAVEGAEWVLAGLRGADRRGGARGSEEVSSGLVLRHVLPLRGCVNQDPG